MMGRVTESEVITCERWNGRSYTTETALVEDGVFLQVSALETAGVRVEPENARRLAKRLVWLAERAEANARANLPTGEDRGQ